MVVNMGSMKKSLQFMAMSMALYASGGGFYDHPRVSRHVPKKLSRGESKKCKSCELYPCACLNQDPMQIACEKYRKRINKRR